MCFSGCSWTVSVSVLPLAAFMHSPHQPVYTATKHGVIGFTRAMAVRHEDMTPCPSGSSQLSRVVFVAGRLVPGRLRGSHQRAVSSLRRHTSAALGGTRGQHGQVCQVQGWFQAQHEQVWSFTVSRHTHAKWLTATMSHVHHVHEHLPVSTVPLNLPDSWTWVCCLDVSKCLCFTRLISCYTTRSTSCDFLISSYVKHLALSSGCFCSGSALQRLANDALSVRKHDKCLFEWE